MVKMTFKVLKWLFAFYSDKMLISQNCVQLSKQLKTECTTKQLSHQNSTLEINAKNGYICNLKVACLPFIQQKYGNANFTGVPNFVCAL